MARADHRQAHHVGAQGGNPGQVRVNTPHRGPVGQDSTCMCCPRAASELDLAGQPDKSGEQGQC
jgi:hypothetical protein